MSRSYVHSVTSAAVLVSAREENAEGVGFNPETRKVERFRTLTKDELPGKKNKERIRKLLGENDWQRLLAIASMKAAVQRRDDRAIKNALGILKDSLGIERQETNPNKDRERLPLAFGESWELHEMLLAQVMGEALSAARLIYWFNEQRSEMEPGLYCPTVSAAVLVELVIGDSFRICPQCRKVFWGAGDRICCSLKCREAHRVARWRERKEHHRER